MSEVRDRWAAASTYEDFMGRWSRLLAPRFVAWLGIPDGVRWLDVGCGTGALTGAICAHASPASVVGCDPAESFIEYARTHLRDSRASFVVAGVDSLPERNGGFGSVTSLLALNFFPDPLRSLHEMRTRALAGGVVSACVWDYADEMQYLRCFWDAAVSIDPAAARFDEGQRFPLCRRPALVDLFRSSGLGDVRCEPIEVAMGFANFNDYWSPFLGGTGPAPSYLTSLDVMHCAALARRLDETLPRSPAGTIEFGARAWAVRGNA